MLPLRDERAAVLVNIGSPAAATPAAVRCYLRQYLMDPCMIGAPLPLRRALVSVITRLRSRRSAAAYAAIWGDEGAPLVAISRRLAHRLQEATGLPVEVGMRYGSPSIEDAVRAVLAPAAGRSIRKIVLIPQFPQHADSTVTSAVDEARRVVRKVARQVGLTVVPPFYDRVEYIRALVDSARPYLDAGFDHLLITFHGVPERHLRRADPSGVHCLRVRDCCYVPSAAHRRCYRAQCITTARTLAARLQLADKRWSLAFQSRLGPGKWIGPYTEAQIDALARSGVRKLLVISPAFTVDCLETLEEIGIRGRRRFLEAGGEELQLIPCLNERPQWVEALAGWLRSEARGLVPD
ncbi:MAG: ferrochelatase [Spirochaetaceae bacterium]|nr:MAG: ferrochelatase [Spirochaetaceae bacterium]